MPWAGRYRHPSMRAHALARAAIGCVATAALVACGGGGGGSGASLTVTVDGLPDGLPADVRVTGVDRTWTVQSTTTLAVTSGAYQVSAEPVARTAAAIVPDERYAASPAVQSVDVTGTANVGVSYAHLSDVVLLVPTLGFGVRVLDAGTLATGAFARSVPSYEAAGASSSTGIAYGPDGRLYLADYDADAIVVADLTRTASSFELTVVGRLTHAQLVSPVGLAFDSTGALWVGVGGGDGAQANVLRFAAEDVSGLSANPTPASFAFQAGGAPGSDEPVLFDVLIDTADRLWVSSHVGDRVLMFDDVRDAEGGTLAATLELRSSSVSGIATLRQPTALVLDDEDRLYVGTASHVARFDAVSSLASGARTPSAMLDTGTGQRHDMLALDASNALWIGLFDGRLVRVLDPETFAGRRVFDESSGDFDRVLAFQSADERAPPDYGGGTLTFVPPLAP